MKEPPLKQKQAARGLTRRQFIGSALSGGAALLLGCAASPLERLARADRIPGPRWRRVWAFADSHIGLGGKNNDGRDGADWLETCLEDLRDRVGDVDYALGLGDLTDHAGLEDELKEYVRVRAASGLPAWYEMAGNHDYAAVPAGRWAKYIRRPPRYVLVDGTIAWFFVSAERGKSDGLVCDETAEWLEDAIARHQSTRNIVVCSHQAVYGTVSSSHDEGSTLNDPDRVARILERVRVDLWLCGHIHAGRRTKGYVARRDRTTFINVASAGRAYGTRACNGYLFDLIAGSNEMLARCREHDHRQYVADQEVRVLFPHAVRFFERPVVIPAPV